MGNPEAQAAEARRLMMQFDRERQRRNEERAKALGYSSLEEYEKVREERAIQIDATYQKQLDEKCARLGKTREELEMEDPQRYVPDCWEPECSCDGRLFHPEDRASLTQSTDHPIPFFCPKTLVDYRSQELMPFLEDQHRLQVEDLRIERGEQSRRLDQELLEDFWDFNSQDHPSKLPPWAVGDKVLQQMIHPRSLPATTVHSGDFRFQSSSPTAVDTEEDETVNDPTAIAAKSAGMDSGSSIQSLQIYEKRQTRQLPSSARTSRSHQISPPDKQSSIASAAGRPQHSRRSRSHKTNISLIKRIQKAAQKPARGTRSHCVTKFYELGPNGIVSSRLHS